MQSKSYVHSPHVDYEHWDSRSRAVRVYPSYSESSSRSANIVSFSMIPRCNASQYGATLGERHRSTATERSACLTVFISFRGNSERLL